MMAAMIGLAAWWSIVLLDRNSWGPEMGAAGNRDWSLVFDRGTDRQHLLVVARHLMPVRLPSSVAPAFSIATASETHGGSIPSAVSTSIRRRRHGGPGGEVLAGTAARIRRARTPAVRLRTVRTGRSGTNGGTAPTDRPDRRTLVRVARAARRRRGHLVEHRTGGAAEVGRHHLVGGHQRLAVRGRYRIGHRHRMAIGGWSGDPAPTLDQFKAYVAAGKIGYYPAAAVAAPAATRRSPHGSAENFTATTSAGPVYKLT